MPCWKLDVSSRGASESVGDLLILFGINSRTCQQCPLKRQCLADGSKGTGGRRITVIRKKLPCPPTESYPVAQPQLIPVSHPTAQPTRSVVWLDFPATRLRRDFTHQLQQHQILITAIGKSIGMAQQTTPLISRNQRAHRRLTWVERFGRNARVQMGVHWQVKLFGISSAVLEWLNSLKPSPVVII